MYYALIPTIPLILGCYLRKILKQVEEGLGLTNLELYQLAKNSFEASFLSPMEKGKFYQD